MKEWKPDCIVSDSMAVWGKLTALKLKIPYISSTTTFAFNRYSARIMKSDLKELFYMLFSMAKANKSLKKLRQKGYPVKGVLSVIQNDNDTNTIVYTSLEFQPCAETFSDKYTFVGPSIRPLDYQVAKPDKKTIYISLGTVNTLNLAFFRNCIDCLRDEDVSVIMSVGNLISIDELRDIPNNIKVETSVNQMEVLQQADIFITHCGMNSVNEALYYELPLILFPQTKEQIGVANRVYELGAGTFLKENSVDAIKEEIQEISNNKAYKENAQKIAESFKKAKGAKLAADKIEEVILHS